jgi:hypothetical protein
MAYICSCWSIGRVNCFDEIKNTRAGAVTFREHDTEGGSVPLLIGQKGAVILSALSFIGLLLSALPASATGLPQTEINRSSEALERLHHPEVSGRASTLQDEASPSELGRLRNRLSLTLGLLDLQKQATDQERNRAEALARELASARQEIARLEAITTATTAVAEKEAFKEQEPGLVEQLNAAHGELSAVHSQLGAATAAHAEAVTAKDSAEAGAAAHEGTLATAQRTILRLTQDVASARAGMEDLKVDVAAAFTAKAEAIEARQLADAATFRAVEAEREKIAGAMASVRDEVELLRLTLATALADTANVIEGRQSAGPAIRSHPLSDPPAKEAPTIGTHDRIEAHAMGWLDRSWGFPWLSIATNSLEYTTLRNGTEKPSVPNAHDEKGGGRDRITPVDGIVGHNTSATETAATQKKPEDEALTRASALVREGDITGARLLLEHALERGSAAEAAFALAATYDPHRLAAWRTLGVRADPIKAQQLYARALEGGVVKAKGRLEALR